MGDYLKLSNGIATDANAVAVSAGPADADKLAKLGASGTLDQSLMPNQNGASGIHLGLVLAVSGSFMQ